MRSGRAASPGLPSRANDQHPDQHPASALQPGLMADLSGQRRPGPRRRHALWRLIRALSSPDSYATVLLLILVTYALSVALTAPWAASLILAVQIAAVWVSLRAARARRPVQMIANVALAVAAVVAAANLIFGDRIDGGSVVLWVSCLLYLAAPVAIVRHLLQRHVVDAETVLGAIAAYLMAGMFFAFLYHAVGADQARPSFFGSHGPGTFSQDLFFSFTTLTTTGYGNLVPSGNPGQTFAVLEMVIGQLFLVVAVAKVVSAWRPGQGRAGLRKDSGDD
jgi:Ion channel